MGRLEPFTPKAITEGAPIINTTKEEQFYKLNIFFLFDFPYYKNM